MVQDILQAILPPIVADLREWTISLRLNASRCLQSVLLLSGAAVSPHLPHLLSPLCSATGDEDAQVAQHVVQCSQVLFDSKHMFYCIIAYLCTLCIPACLAAEPTADVAVAMLH